MVRGKRGRRRSEGEPEELLPLTPAWFHILLSLLDEPKHGYGVKREVEERTDGTIRLGAGTLYGALERMRERGLIAEAEAPSTDEAQTSRWRYYEATPRGRDVAVAELRRLAADVREAEAKLGEARGAER